MTGEWMTDLRVAARVLRKSPAFTAAAVIVLALGIGANAAVFSAVKATLLAPPPFPDPDRLMLLDLTASDDGAEPRAMPWSYPKFRMLEETEGLSADLLAAYAVRSVTLTGSGDAAVLPSEIVTPDYLDVLGIDPVVGRDLVAGDDTEGSAPVVLLSHAVWRDRFGGDPDAVGGSITLNGRTVQIVGVTPAGFHGVSGQGRLFMPVHAGAQLIAPFLTSAAQAHWMRAVGRLAEGAELRVLQDQLAAAGAAIAETWPDPDPSMVISAAAQPLVDARMNPQARRSLVVLSAAAALLLLVACANLAGLLVARASRRRKETAVRTALGAGRWRVARSAIVESLLLSALGGAAAVVVARFGADWLVRAWPGRFVDGSWNVQFADLASVQVDGGVLLFAAGTALLAGLVFGALPALAALRTSPGETLREGTGASLGGSRGGIDLRTGLVAAEVALALVLLVGAGLLLRSLDELASVERGYERGGLLVFDVPVPRTSDWADDAAGFHDSFVERITALPGVESAGVGCIAPVSGHCMITGVASAGDRSWPEGSRPSLGVHYVGDDYFRTLGVRLVQGRTFAAEDQAESRPVAVLSEMAARELFPEGGALGRTIESGASSEGRAEVVGIVGDVLYDRPERGMMAEMYLSHRQSDSYGTYLVRARGEPLALVPAIRSALAAIDPDIPLVRARSMEDIEADVSADTRILSTLLVAFGALALLLACTGVWAMVSFAVAQRTRELGLRVALGAAPGKVVALVVRGGTRATVVGLALGAAAAWFASRLLESLLFDVPTRDPLAFLGGAAVLAAVATLAAWMPARRATRIDPMEALRAE